MITKYSILLSNNVSYVFEIEEGDDPVQILVKRENDPVFLVDIQAHQIQIGDWDAEGIWVEYKDYRTPVQ